MCTALSTKFMRKCQAKCTFSSAQSQHCIVSNLLPTVNQGIAVSRKLRQKAVNRGLNLLMNIQFFNGVSLSDFLHSLVLLVIPKSICCFCSNLDSVVGLVGCRFLLCRTKLFQQQLVLLHSPRSPCLGRVLQESGLELSSWRKTQRPWARSTSPTLMGPSSSAWSPASTWRWSWRWPTVHLPTVHTSATQPSWVKQVTSWEFVIYLLITTL